MRNNAKDFPNQSSNKLEGDGPRAKAEYASKNVPDGTIKYPSTRKNACITESTKRRRQPILKEIITVDIRIKGYLNHEFHQFIQWGHTILTVISLTLKSEGLLLPLPLLTDGPRQKHRLNSLF